MDIHDNARSTRHSRMLMVRRLRSGWTVAAVARAQGVSSRTVRKWRDRHATEGEAGLADRSSRPHRSLASPPLATQHLRDVGDTDQQLLGDLSHPQACVPCCEDTLPQVLRIRFATLPKHADLRSTVPETHESQVAGVSEAPIPVNLSTL
jgi:transposase-like protein